MDGMRYRQMAVDFGTSNTIVAFWDEETKDVVLHEVADVTRPFHFDQDGLTHQIPCIPSMIYYQNRNTTFVGEQVIAKMLENQQGSFRWMKAYIQSGRRINYPLPDGSAVDFFVAARDFLEKVLLFAGESGRVDVGNAEVAFTVPVESFEDYTNWLTETCHDLGIRRYRFIDESTACIFGYDTHLQPGDVFSVIDFGGGTLDVSIVRIEEKVDRGRGCRVMGKAGCRIGGRTIDGWLYADLLKRADIHVLDARPASALFMQQVEQIKEYLSDHTAWEYDVQHWNSGLRLKGVYHRDELENLLEKKRFYHDVRETLERAESQARERGLERSHIKEVLLVGGTSQIPSVRRLVSLFHRYVRFYRPFDAVARGACRYLTNEIEDLYDHIQHDYAIKSYDTHAGTHRFLTLVPRGTRYPTAPEFRKMTLAAVRDQQRFFGIDIYEISEKGSTGGGMGEIMFDLNGGVMFDKGGNGGLNGTEFWMNEGNPMFIEAGPTAERGIKRFSVSFRVCAQKNLRVTVRDLLTRKLLYDDYAVVKLK
jgi:molecular chaperone DnaK